MSSTQTSFYVAGGAMQRHSPSYVQRQADDDLYADLVVGRFCYVLTSRQMGKSSLMVRTAERLRAEGFTVVNLDLTAVGQNLTAEQWYNGLLGDIRRKLDPNRLGLDAALKKFWEDNAHLGPLQRWMHAIREVALENTKARLVIFVDEIDYVRSLPFSTDEFFAAIREFYNRRTEDPELERLTFCLLGVATPSDLIRDTRTTPFNIGIRIELADFNESEAAPLAQGLRRDEASGAVLLNRILYWTGGHPYLTQRLCLAIAEDGSVTDAGGVDRKCEELFLASRARESDENLLFVRERLLRSAEADRASLLDLYQKIHNNKRIPDDETNLLVSVLRLSGITRAASGLLRVRNRIYRHAFDKAWIAASMPDAELQRQRAAYRKGLLRAAAIAAVIILALAGLAGAAVHQRNRAEAALAQVKDSEAKLRRESEEKDQARKSAQEASDRASLETQRTKEALDTADRRRLEAEVQTGIANERKRQADEQRRQADKERGRAEEATREANRAADKNRRLLYAASMGLAQQAWEAADLPRLLMLLDEQRPERSGGEDLRGFEWYYLWRLAHSDLSTLQGPEERVNAVTLSSDGRLVATGSDEGNLVRVRDVLTGREKFKLRGHTSPVTRLVFSSDGRRLVSSGRDGVVLVWDVESGRPLCTLSGHAGLVSDIGVSYDGRRVVTVDNTVKTWDAETGQPLLTLTQSGDEKGGFAYKVAISPDGRRIVTENFRAVKVWDADTGNVLYELAGARMVGSLVLYSSIWHIITASGDQSPQLRVGETGQVMLTFSGDINADYQAMAFSPDGRRLVTGGYDRAARIWDATTGRELLRFKGHMEHIAAAVFSPDGTRIITATRSGTVKVWDAMAEQERRKLPGRQGVVNSPAYLPRLNRFITNGPDNYMTVWELDTGRELFKLGGRIDNVFSVALSRDGRRIAISCWHDVLTGSGDNTTRIWDVGTGRVLSSIEGSFIGMDFSPDGRRLATGSALNAVLSTGGNTAKVWDVETGRELLTLSGHSNSVRGVSFSFDGRRLATGSDDGTARVWDAQSGRELHTLKGHADLVVKAAFSPDGRRVVTCSNDDTLKVWDVESERATLTLKFTGGGTWVDGLAFSADGQYVFVVDRSGSAEVWAAGTVAEMSAPIHYQLGVVYMQKKDYAGAIDAFTQVLRLEPRNVGAFILRGRTRLALNNVPPAIDDCSDAVRVDPTDANARFCLGDAFMTKGDFSAARREYVEVLKLDPDNFNAHYNLACLYSLRSATYPKGTAGEISRAADVALALDHLEQARKDRDRLSDSELREPKLNAIRSDPRFLQVLKDHQERR